MKYIPVSECRAYAQSEVQVRGWVHRIRKQKDDVFLTLRDSTGLIQCVLPRNEETSRITRESSITLNGIVTEDARAPGGYEIRGNATLVGAAQEYPIGKDQSPELLNEQRHLWLRSRKMTDIMKVRETAVAAARTWFADNAWHETWPPILNKSAAEGGSTLFSVPFFDEKLYLSQSAQLYLEALIYSLGDVWSLTPSFRAEKSKTPRHLAEYWHLEGEGAWRDFDSILEVEERLVEHMSRNVAYNVPDELRRLGRDPDDLLAVTAPFKRIAYADVIAFLQHGGHDLHFGDDLGTEHERALTQGSLQPVFIYGAPKAIKPFYTKVDPADERLVLSADMIAPEGFGEISSGGQREEDLDSIVTRLRHEGFDPVDYSWYLDLRRFGSVPHSGFGIGIERIIRWMCNLEHIRDAIPFPRTMARNYP